MERIERAGAPAGRWGFWLGVNAVVGQVLLLRELVTIFYGNELAYAMILASWLVWVSVGSFLGGRFLFRRLRPTTALRLGLWLVGVFLPLTVAGVRAVPRMLGVSAGTLIGPGPIGVAVFSAVAPLAFCFGAWFPSVCRYAGSTGSTVRRVYFWEAVGSAVGGVAVTLVLIPILSAFGVAVIAAAGDILAAGRVGGRRGPVEVVIAGLLILLIPTGATRRVDFQSRRWQYGALPVVAVKDSLYGNLVLVRRGEEFTLYENGLLSYATGDRLGAEERAHFALLAHPDPRRVLLIGGGVGGLLAEVLKHPVERVDYVELDPAVISFSREHLPPAQTAPLRDPRTRVHVIDGRLLVKRGADPYDVIIVALPDPYTALLNRYYSLEFFREAHRLLVPGGVLSLAVSSSENYVGPETRALLRSLTTTLRSVFRKVLSIPGDTQYFLATDAERGVSRDPEALARRLRQRGIRSLFITPETLPIRLNAWRIAQVDALLRGPGLLNTDLRPIAYLYDILAWTTRFSTGFSHFIRRVRMWGIWPVAAAPLALLAFGWVTVRRTDPLAARDRLIGLSIMTTGFSEIIFQILVIMAFQSLYGYAYHKIGVIIAAFMAGLALGVAAARRVSARGSAGIIGMYRRVQAGVCLYPLSLPLCFLLFGEADRVFSAAWLFSGVFASLPVLAGLLGGIQYPLALELMSAGTGGRVSSASRLYALDVLGAAAGALVTGAILIPLWGIPFVVGLCAAVNAAVWIVLGFLDRRAGDQPARSSARR